MFLIGGFAWQLQWPLSLLGYMLTELADVVIDSEKALKLLGTVSDIVDKPGAPDLVITNGEIEFGLSPAKLGQDDGAN